MATLQQRAERASQLLKSLRDQLKDHKTPEAKKWLNEIVKLESYATKPSTVIGVVGATGVGKSALINALLDEELILPTNCMRACTAAVTEISFNTFNVPYRAEIEFISKAQWHSELQILLKDISDGSGKVSKNAYSDNSEASIAYAKIKAVYPNLAKEQIAHTSIAELMSYESKVHLGTTAIIEEKDAGVFHKKLRVYIDSRGKISHCPEANTSSAKVLEFWPLIRVVKLYIRSRTLETGAVIVDLPGVHDSNAARAAVAQTYLKRCAGVFIVAPITRAVDDKLAKTLLDQSFKQQLKLDGNLGNITFICSKTDIVTTSEVQESLGLEDELDPLRQRMNRLVESMQRLRAEHEETKGIMKSAKLSIRGVDEELETWMSRLLQPERGPDVRVLASIETGVKRKHITASTSSRKKSTNENLFRINADTEGHNRDEQTEVVVDHLESAGATFTKDQIKQEIMQLQQAKDAIRRQFDSADDTLETLEQALKQHNDEHNTLRGRTAKICILARNEYSRAVIKQDFADGVNDFDQDLLAEHDPDNFNLSKAIPDYDEVAKSLPVFCVSTHGYQKLCGRLEDEKNAWGFEDPKDTEIPQLQAHCRHLADTLRDTSAEFLLRKTSMLCTSLRIWISRNDQQHNLGADELTHMEQALKADLQDFSKTLLETSTNVLRIISDDIKAHILNKFAIAVKKAKAKAGTTVHNWGGLHHMTYKAIVRRGGFYLNQEVVHDFNRELVDPLIGQLTHGWENVFMRLIPAALEETLSRCEKIITNFQTKITTTAVWHIVSASSLQLLTQQLKERIASIGLALDAVKSAIRTQQKDINRQFIPTIAQDMSEVYAECATEQGKGMFDRMRHTMRIGAQEASDLMFQSCVDVIERDLKQMIERVGQELQLQVEDNICWIEYDYMQLFANTSQQILDEEKPLKGAIILLVEDYVAKEDKTVPATVAATAQVQVKSEIGVETPYDAAFTIHTVIPIGNQEPTGQAQAVDDRPVTAQTVTQAWSDDSDSDTKDMLF